jgi:hypothetical protein
VHVHERADMDLLTQKINFALIRAGLGMAGGWT